MEKKTMKEHYKRGKEEYYKFIKENNRIPTEDEWSELAKEKGLPSTVSMRYMGNITYKKGTF